MKFDRTKMLEALRRVVQRMHYPLEVMLVCVRWYAAYPLRACELFENQTRRLSRSEFDPSERVRIDLFDAAKG